MFFFFTRLLLCAESGSFPEYLANSACHRGLLQCALGLRACLSHSVPFRETPSYTNRRRVMPGTLPSPRSLLRSASDNNLNGDHDHIHSPAPREIRGRQGHSPVPSLRSLPALGQQHSSLGEVGEGFRVAMRVCLILCCQYLSNLIAFSRQYALNSAIYIYFYSIKFLLRGPIICKFQFTIVF